MGRDGNRAGAGSFVADLLASTLWGFTVMRSASSWNSWSAIVLLLPGGLAAQEAYKVEELKQAPPSSIAPELSASLNSQAYRIKTADGKTFADFWLRKSIPAATKPSGANGVIQFPFLEQSELLGVVQLAVEGHDYRDQAIAKGAYTVRFGLQPVNGDHLGVSPFRDYILLLPAAKDRTLAILPRKQMETGSAEAVGSSHPAILFMLAVPGASKPVKPSMVHDAEKNTWRLVVPLSLQVKGEPQPLEFPVSIVVVGTSEAA
jgi:hypothetical protein